MKKEIGKIETSVNASLLDILGIVQNKENGKIETSVNASLLDILGIVQNSDKEPSSQELSKAISALQAMKQKAERREEEEQKRREREERERLEKEAKINEEKRVANVTSMDLPLDWENVFNSDKRTQGVHVDSISDGLILSLTELGRVDIEYISSVTAEDYKTVICALKGSIFQNPDKWEECFYKGWETSDEYLSGNLIRKLKTARRANEKYRGYFSENVAAIEKALPDVVPSKDIYVTLGSPWVPTDIIDDFITHILGKSYNHTMHDEISGTWELPYKSLYKDSVRSESTYGTQRIQALYILEKTLNMKTVAVKDEISCPTNASGKKLVVNETETVAALEKQTKMIKEFQRWVWQDKSRESRLEQIFQDKYGCVRRRLFDGKLKGWLGFFDAAIIEPKPFADEAEFKKIKPAGGGGTDFQIIFEYVAKHMTDEPPASIIILTDGYAPFPQPQLAMNIPVLWLLNNEEVTPPWGKIARIKV